MTNLIPKGNLITLVGFDPSGNIVPLQVTADGYLIANYEMSGAGAGTMLTPKGNLTSPIAFDPSGNVLPLQVTAEGYLRVSVENLPASDLTLIEDKTLGADASTFDFQNIVATYKHLKVFAHVRSKKAANTDTLQLVINNDTGNNYDFLNLRFAHNANYQTGEGIGQALIQVASIPAANAPANLFGEVDLTLPSYSLVSHLRSVIILTGRMDAQSSTNIIMNNGVGYYRSTVAISRLTFSLPAAVNFLAGSQISLYGLK